MSVFILESSLFFFQSEIEGIFMLFLVTNKLAYCATLWFITFSSFIQQEKLTFLRDHKMMRSSPSYKMVYFSL